jgi:hypothetical protein
MTKAIWKPTRAFLASEFFVTDDGLAHPLDGREPGGGWLQNRLRMLSVAAKPKPARPRKPVASKAQVEGSGIAATVKSNPLSPRPKSRSNPKEQALAPKLERPVWAQRMSHPARLSSVPTSFPIASVSAEN